MFGPASGAEQPDGCVSYRVSYRREDIAELTFDQV